MPSAKRLGQTDVWLSIMSNSSFTLKGLHYIQNLIQSKFRWLTIILEFLNLPWEDAVLHHEQQINKPGGVRVFNILTQD